MRYVMFKLGMPNVGSWNNKWSHKDRLFASIIRLPDRSKQSKIESEEKIKLWSGSHYYDFEDGWGASVTVKEVDEKEAKLINKNSDGFSGYDWMITMIMNHGRILTRSERGQFEATAIIGSVIKTDVDKKYSGLDAFIQAKYEYLNSIKYDQFANVYTNMISSLLSDKDQTLVDSKGLENEVSLSVVNQLPKNSDYIVKKILSLTYDQFNTWSVP